MLYLNSIPNEEKYRNIGGWLLLFSVVLIVGPIINFIETFKLFFDILEWYNVNFFNFISAIIDYIIFASLMILAIASGVAILSKKAIGIKTAKIYLFLWLLYSISKVIFSYAYGNQELFGESVIFCFKTTGYSAIWILYLFKSERVKYTFNLV